MYFIVSYLYRLLIHFKRQSILVLAMYIFQDCATIHIYHLFNVLSSAKPVCTTPIWEIRLNYSSFGIIYVLRVISKYAHLDCF